MSENLIQTAFSAGELAPTMYSRVDLAKYRQGAARMLNMFVDYRSGSSTKMGSRFVIQAYNSSKQVRLIPFQYSSQNTFALEFGDQYIRFITNAGAVLEPTFAISGATNGNPGQLTVVGNPYVNGDWLFVDGLAGATGYNGRFVTVTVAGNILTLFDVNGNAIDASGFGAYTTGGTVARVYKISSPYLAADLSGLKFTQSASVLTITHPSYPQYNLTQVGAANWTLTAVVIGSTATAPAAPTITASGAGTAQYAYVVTSVDSNGQESTPSAPGASGAVVNITTTAGSIYVAWGAAAGASSYNVYKAEISIGAAVPSGAAFGFVGSATGVAFTDSNIVPDFTQTPPIAKNPFSGTNYPAVVTYYQQREVYGSSNTLPLSMWFSQPGNFNNFNKSDPIQDSDAITITLVSDQVNQIQWMKAMPGGLIVGTSKGAWQINGGSGGVGVGGSAITPANIVAIPQAYNGTSDLPPIVVNYDILYVQAKGSIVRDLAYNIYANIYTGMDISVLSNHLFTGYKISEWAYAEEPHKLIWAIRDNGTMLSLCFVKEQEIYGWSRHTTQGLYKSICSITETSLIQSNVIVDSIYCVVRRYIRGQWLQYIERFADRAFPYGVEDTWAVDSGVQSPLTKPVATISASAMTGTVTFTASAAVFVAGDVGKVLRMVGGIATITSFVSATQVIGTVTQAIQGQMVPVEAASGDWNMAMPFTTFTGLDHLEGQTVSILADGGVVAPKVVVNGRITLSIAASKVTVGLGYTCQLQTMNLDVGDPTVQGKRKKVNALTVRMVETRGLQVGRTFDTLVPVKELYSTTTLDQASALVTGDERVVMDPLWDIEGRICIQVTDPLPATISGVIPEITIGDDDK